MFAFRRGSLTLIGNENAWCLALGLSPIFVWKKNLLSGVSGVHHKSECSAIPFRPLFVLYFTSVRAYTSSNQESCRMNPISWAPILTRLSKVTSLLLSSQFPLATLLIVIICSSNGINVKQKNLLEYHFDAFINNFYNVMEYIWMRKSYRAITVLTHCYQTHFMMLQIALAVRWKYIIWSFLLHFIDRSNELHFSCILQARRRRGRRLWTQRHSYY